MLPTHLTTELTIYTINLHLIDELNGTGLLTYFT